MSGLETGLTIVSSILVVLAGILGFSYKKLLKELRELFDAIKQARRDGKITPEEMANIISESRDIVTALKDIVLISWEKRGKSP